METVAAGVAMCVPMGNMPGEQDAFLLFFGCFLHD
jgi:hypothetical protein